MTTKKVTLALLCAAMAVSTQAFAAPAGAAAASPSDDNSISEIVVTAEKRSENLEAVPVAISAFTAKERDLIGIESLQDITNFTPGLGYSTSLDRAFIRGVGRDTNNLATDPGVATYVDGVYNSATVSAAEDSLFLDRIEVLRGPQGTLYGRNAIAGTIDAVSRRPTQDLYAEVRANFGNYGVKNFEAAVSGPITDSLRVRFAGYRDDQSQGYFRNLADGSTEGGRGTASYWEGQVEWDITSDVEFWLKIGQTGYNNTYRASNFIGSYDYAPYPLGNTGPGAGFGFTTPGFTQLGSQTQNPGNANIRDFSANTPNDAKLTRDYTVTPQLTWRTPWAADLKYIGGYTTYYYSLYGDFDGTSLTSYTFPVFNPATPPLQVFATAYSHYVENKKYYSNELNLTSHSDSPLQWIVGLFQYHEKYDQPLQIVVPDQPQWGSPLFIIPQLAPAAPLLIPAPANPGLSAYSIDQDMHDNSYAAFAQTDWKFVPTMKFTLGARYSYDEKAGSESTRQLCFGLPACLGTTPFPGPSIFGAGTPVTDITSAVIAMGPYPGVKGAPVFNPATGFWSRQLGATWNAVTGTAGIEWTPTDNILGYLKYSRGYKAGGFNTGTIAANPETAPEHLDAYELGGKMLFNKQFQINAALYYYNYKDLQIPVTVQPTTGPSITSVFNMPKTVSYGAEFETIWQPITNLQFLLNYSYEDATIRSDINVANAVGLPTANPLIYAPSVQNVNGATIPESPRHKVAVNGNYTFHFAPGLLNFSTSYVWKAATYDSIFNEPYNLAPAFSQVDMRLTWTDIKDRFTIFGYVKNLQNKIGYDGVGAGPVSQPAPGFVNYDVTAGLTPPRTYGVEIQYRLK
jgi:iron complex outermembrane receptor protein